MNNAYVIRELLKLNSGIGCIWKNAIDSCNSDVSSLLVEILYEDKQINMSDLFDYCLDKGKIEFCLNILKFCNKDEYLLFYKKFLLSSNLIGFEIVQVLKLMDEKNIRVREIFDEGIRLNDSKIIDCCLHINRDLLKHCKYGVSPEIDKIIEKWNDIVNLS